MGHQHSEHELGREMAGGILDQLLDRLFDVELQLRGLRKDHTILARYLAALHVQGDAIMSVSKELQDALDKIDNATNAIGTRVGSIADQIRTGMSQQEVNDVVTKLNAEADKLNTIAADPNNPVPPSATGGTTGGVAGGAGAPGT